MRWPVVGQSVVVCFVVGRRQVPNATLAALDDEAARHRDLLFLPQISDGCVKLVSIGKTHSFWIRAARLVQRNRARDGSSPPATIAKADDDSFVHVPNLQLALMRLSCVRRLYYGALAFSGYQPAGFQNCGFAWGGDGAYHKYGCERGGAHPPIPFALGQLQALSLDAALGLTASRDAREFAAAAEDVPTTMANEDSSLGFMMSRVANVTYASMAVKAWHNLGCWPAAGMYRIPVQNTSVVIHRLLSIRSLRYVWEVMRGALAHDVVACEMASVRNAEGESDAALKQMMRRWCDKCVVEGANKRHKDQAPRGCKDVSSSAKLQLVRSACEKHGLVPPGTAAMVAMGARHPNRTRTPRATAALSRAKPKAVMSRRTPMSEREELEYLRRRVGLLEAHTAGAVPSRAAAHGVGRHFNSSRGAGQQRRYG